MKRNGYFTPSRFASVFLSVVTAGAIVAAAHAAEPAKLPAAVRLDDEDNWQVPVTVGKDGWLLYHNERFGFVLPVPPGLRPLRPPVNGDGQAFVSADGKVQLTASGSFNVDHMGDVAQRWKDALAEPERTITYKRKTDTWCVISGVRKDGTGFYERYTADKNHCASWSMTYPQAEEKKYAAWIERVANGYQARLGMGLDTLQDEGSR